MSCGALGGLIPLGSRIPVRRVNSSWVPHPGGVLCSFFGNFLPPFTLFLFLFPISEMRVCQKSDFLGAPPPPPPPVRRFPPVLVFLVCLFALRSWNVSSFVLFPVDLFCPAM